ncbi:MAG: hypothetical protein RID53_17520 [Coleofasciculus sp. B1-GNL1-01]
MYRAFVKASIPGKPNDRVTKTQDQEWLTLFLYRDVLQRKTDK